MKRIVRPQRHLSKKYHQLQQQRHSQQLRRLPLRQPQFIKDSIVEVSSKEEGFIGAWFTATILKLPSFRDRLPFIGKVYVEYKSLLSDEDPSKLLREYVKVELVRPVPPAEDHRETFNVGDVVDAFYDDGWWTGTVTEIVYSEFRVFFKNPPHDIVFCPSNLRIHRDWIKGSWVPPVNQTVAGKTFSMGTRMEVCFDVGTSLDVWYPATVLEDKGNCTFLVECQQSDGNGGSKIRKETVDSLHIRPVPPFPNSRNFLLLEKVDAFYDFGWWGGVITKELTGSRYVVFINHTKVDKEFAFSELRGHMEWKHGEWFTASQDASIPSYHRNNENGTKNKIKFESNIGIALPLTNSVSMRSSSQKKRAFSRKREIEMAIPGSDKDPVFDSKLTSYEKSVHVASLDNVGVENGIIRQPLCADQLIEGHSLRKRGRTKRAKIVEKEENTVIGSKNTEESKTPAKKLQNAAEAGKEGNETEDVHGACLTVDINLPIVVGLACDNARTPRSKRSYRSNGEETVKRGSIWVNLDETKLNVVQVTKEVNGSEKKRRGRPRKSSVEASILTMNGSVEATDGGVGGGSSNDQIKQEENQLDSIKSTTSPSSKGGENALEASRKPRGKQLTKRGSKRKTNLMNLISKVHEDVASPNTAKENYVINEEVSVEESPNNTFDNQPLANWIGNVGARSSLTRCNSDASGVQKEIVKERPAAAVDEIRPVGIELQSLPFEKKSALWSALESMEVFQKLPQKLHFQPLEHVKETVREGLAIGTMVTFTSVVEKTSKLQFDDTNESIDSILETLLELETHGFDVGVIRERVSRLRRMKEKQEKVQEEVDKLMSEMTEHELAKSNIDGEIEEISRQIKELQEKLIEAKSMTARKNGEIESLQLKLKGVEEGFGNIRCEFEGQSPWP